MQNQVVLKIGQPDGGEAEGLITMPYRARSAHMHVLGRTRSGKSRFLADLIRQDIINGNGVGLLDPHGELYELTVNWLAQSGQRSLAGRRKIHPIRLTDPATALRYNPLHIDEPDEAYTVAANVTEAITRIYGGKDSSETPLFSFVLDIVCTVLALRGLPLAAAEYFLLSGEHDREIRDQISVGVPDEYFRRLGLQFSDMQPKEFRDTVGSTGRRLHEFLRNPLVKRIFSTTENTLPLKQIMDEGHVLLIDASDQGGRLVSKELKTIGSLFVNNLFGAARQRDPKTKPRPFMLYIDEVQNYVNNDIEDILSQAAKRGLYLTLAHQFLEQLREAGELVYSGVMSGTLIKAIFQITIEEADVLADELFAPEVDFERVKEKLAAPHVTGHEKDILFSHSEARAVGQSATRARGTSHAEGLSSGLSEAIGQLESSGLSQNFSYQLPDGTSIGLLDLPQQYNLGSSSTLGTSRQLGKSQASSWMSGSSFLHGEVESEQHVTSIGEAETLRPIIEWFSTKEFSLEEQRYEFKRRLAFQPQRHGFLAVGREGAIGFTTRQIPDMLHIPLNEARLLTDLQTRSPWIASGADVPPPLSVADVQTRLGLRGRPADPNPEPDDYFEPVE